MATDARTPDVSRLVAFAARLDGLDAAAWDRIAERCALLDGRSVDGFLGRMELSAQSLIPDTSTYERPGVRPAMAAMGTFFGVLGEVAMAMGGFSEERYEEEAARLRRRGSEDKQAAGLAAYLAVMARAARERSRHPGTAAALHAVAMALLPRAGSGGAAPDVYSPFEPEIPYASLPALEERAP